MTVSIQLQRTDPLLAAKGSHSVGTGTLPRKNGAGHAAKITKRKVPKRCKIITSTQQFALIIMHVLFLSATEKEICRVEKERNFSRFENYFLSG